MTAQENPSETQPASALPLVLALILLSVVAILGWGAIEQFIQRPLEEGRFRNLMRPPADLELPAIPSLPEVPVMPPEQPYREPQFPISYQEVQR